MVFHAMLDHPVTSKLTKINRLSISQVGSGWIVLGLGLGEKNHTFIKCTYDILVQTQLQVYLFFFDGTTFNIYWL